MSKLSGNKDVDREILSKIDDKELLKICSIDKYTWNTVCDDEFLRRRLLAKYPEIEKYKLKKETWKRFFLRAIRYIALMKEKFQFEYKSGNFKKQYKLLNRTKNKKALYRNTEILYIAVKEGDLDLVKYAVNNGASVRAHRNGPLREAATRGDLDMVKFLVENGANIHENILQYAIENERDEIVQYLIEKGAKI